MKAAIYLIIILLTTAFISCGQTSKNNSPKAEFKVLAKLVSSGEGSKIYIAKYKIIKGLED